MTILLWLAFVLFALRRQLTYLHIFQQEEYDARRFLRWIFASFAVDMRATAALAAIGVIHIFWPVPLVFVYVAAAVALLAIAAFESDPRKKAKKKLAMTARARRVYFLALALAAALAAVCAVILTSIWPWIALIQLIPFTLALAVLLLSPFESRIQKKFWNEAHAKLLNLKPSIVGITGSYGKTSVKHILSHILGSSAPTLSTPGSVNTPMGISRIVREELGPHHRFFICEMGAYGPGSIARLCRLAPPSLAVITAIGPAHYERFKSLDVVARTKFELATATVQRGGRVILAEQTLDFPDAQNFYDRHKNQVLLVGSSSRCTFQYEEPLQTPQGIEVVVAWKGVEYHLRSHLYGRHQASNLAVAFAAACELGVPPEDAVTAVASIPQITHRLEVKRQGNGQVVIDDAYNSNPAGFSSALQVLDVVRNGSGRRILVTPGMVELGAMHDEAHRKAGLEAAQHVDVLLAVLPGRIATFLDAFRAANPQATVIECATFADARQWMQDNLQAADVVLLENDLPDLYERKLRL